MKTKEELNALRLEVEALNAKLAELTVDELDQVIGGRDAVPEQTIGDFDPPRDDLKGDTKLVCSSCKIIMWWHGDFQNQRFDCPFCGGKNTLIGGGWR